MGKIKNSYYSLLHFTSEVCYKKIVDSKGFKLSIHDIDKCKIQWLGDGVYFWSVNDPYAKKLGISLLKGKRFFSKIVEIIVNIEVNDNKVIDFENEYWNNEYLEFLKKVYPKIYPKIIEYKEMIHDMSSVSSRNGNLLGKLTGTTLNSFFKYLSETKGVDIDLVIGYFHHNINCNSNFVFSRKRKDVAQFCIRNVEIVNCCIDNWKINII